MDSDVDTLLGTLVLVDGFVELLKVSEEASGKKLRKQFCNKLQAIEVQNAALVILDEVVDVVAGAKLVVAVVVVALLRVVLVVVLVAVVLVELVVLVLVLVVVFVSVAVIVAVVFRGVVPKNNILKKFKFHSVIRGVYAR